MPSESLSSERERLDLARSLVAGRWQTFRSFVVAAHERARGILATEGGEALAKVELGEFGARRIDAGRFAALNAGRTPLDTLARERIARATDVLGELLASSTEPIVVDVPPQVSLRFAVASAYARLGRAFGASIVLELARSGRYDPAAHDRLLEWCGFDEWSSAERRAAPPLIIAVNGADLRGGALSAFLDGGAHLAVVARGACAPAPLVGVVSPRTLVLQTTDLTGTDRFIAYDGPAVAMLASPDSACFLHDPAAGKNLWQRLRIWQRPTSPPRRTIGGFSPRQQLDALAQLEALAERPSFSDTPLESLAPGSGDPSELLASWLLAESGATRG